MPDLPAEHDDATEQPATRPDHHGSVKPVVDADAKKRRRRKRLRLLAVLVLLFALTIALTPTLLSTGPGTRWLVSFISSQTPGELAVDDLQLGWLGGQRVKGVSYSDPARGLEAHFEAIDAADIGLLGLLRGSHRYGNIELVGSQVSIAELETKQDAADASRQSATKAQDAPLRLPRGMSGTLRISDFTLAYKPIGREPIELTIEEDEIRVADLREISLALDAKVSQGRKQGRFALKGEVLNLFNPDGAEQFEQAAYDIALDVTGLPIAALDQVFSGVSDAQPGQLLALLGDGELLVNATLSGTIDKLASGLTVESPKLFAQLKQLAEDDLLVASPNSSAKLDLDQDSFAALFPDSGLKLHKPTTIHLESLEMAWPIVGQSVDWKAATASFLLKAGDELAVVDEGGGVLGINDLRITGGSSSIAEIISFKLATELTAVNAKAQVTSELIEVDLDIVNPMEQTREIAFFSEKLPIGLIDALIGKGWELPVWLGETLLLVAEVRSETINGAALSRRFDLRPEGRVTGTVTGSWARDRFSFSTPANEPVQAVLTPQAFARLMEMLSGRKGEPALTIDEDMPVFITLRDPERGAVSVTPRLDKTGVKRFYPDPDRTHLGATIELSPATVFDPKLKKTYELRGGSISVHAPDLRGKTKLRAELDLWVRPDAGKEGVASLLTWDTTVTDLLDTEGSLPLDGAALMQQIAAVGGMKLENVPSGLMDTLLNREGDLASILGPIVQQMDAGFTYKDSQPTGASVRLNWDDANKQPLPDAWASMKPAQFDIDSEQMLTVRGGEDLELEVRISEAFGDRWMGQLHPILFDAKSGDRPVKIRIDGKRFRFPLKSETMQGSRVEAQVDLGTVVFGDDALLGKLMAWTDRPGERAVFEPATVRLVDGKVSYDQFDLAVGKVKLRLDGEVDLASGQIVDLAVRVPGDSLIRVFNELDGVIPKDDYLSIPMTGAIREPRFDSRLIGREVARLLAQGLIEKQLKDLIKDGDGEGRQHDAQEGEPEDQPEKSIEQELIEQGLGLLFKRLGKDRDEPKQE
eukprot:g12364.t1